MKGKILLVCTALIFGSFSGLLAKMGALYDLESSPFASNIASKPGDILTVVVMEETETSDVGKKGLNKKHEMDFGITDFFLPHFKPNVGFDDTKGTGDAPAVKLDTENKYTADIKNDSSSFFKTQLQVRVVEEVSEGQLVIRGHRIVKLEGKDKEIFLSGVVRQDDIGDDNTIASHLIADAVIEIEGETMKEDLEPGYIGSVLTKLFF